MIDKSLHYIFKMDNLVNFISIFSSNRLDAEFFQPKYLKITKNIYGNKYKPLHELCEFIQTGPSGSLLPSSGYVSYGIKIIRPSNLNNWTVNNGSFVYTSKTYIQKNNLKLYKAGDILISRIGDIKFGIIQHASQAAISPNLIAVRVKKQLLDAFYLLAFLNTKSGFDQIHRGTKKVSISSIDTVNISNIFVPIISFKEQSEIGNLIKKAIEKQEKAKKLYIDTENLLLKVINYSKINKINTKNKFNYSNLLQANRADAEYLIKQNNLNHKYIDTEQLGEICEIKRGIDPGRNEYQKEGQLLLRTSNITKFGLIAKSQKYISEELFNKLSKKYQPQPGEILFVKDGSPGIAYVVNKSIESIVSDGIVRIKIKNSLSPEYVAFCINSAFCRDQIMADIDGTLIPHLKIEQIKKIRIPIFDPAIQDTLVTQLIKTFSLLQNAEEDLSKARQLISHLTHSLSS